MHHPILLMLGIFFLARLLVRRARWRRFAHAGHGCGRFGHHHWRRRGPIDLGAPDDDWQSGGLRLTGRHRFRWAQRWERGQRVDPQAATPPAPKAIDVAGTLELNPRQKTLFEDIVAKAKGSLPAGTLATALAEVAREPFDGDRVSDLVGPGDLADDLLQLHHSLTPEQRARLRDVTAA